MIYDDNNSSVIRLVHAMSVKLIIEQGWTWTPRLGICQIICTGLIFARKEGITHVYLHSSLLKVPSVSWPLLAELTEWLLSVCIAQGTLYKAAQPRARPDPGDDEDDDDGDGDHHELFQDKQSVSLGGKLGGGQSHQSRFSQHIRILCPLCSHPHLHPTSSQLPSFSSSPLGQSRPSGRLTLRLWRSA